MDTHRKPTGVDDKTQIRTRIDFRYFSILCVCVVGALGERTPKNESIGY
jgi:hypothetical protein